MKAGTEVLYTIGALFGVFALAYFGTEVVVGLSPEVKALLLFFAFVVFLVVGNVVDKLQGVTYALAAGAFLVFVLFVLGNFGLSPTVVFLLLVGSSIMFVGLGYLEHTDRVTLDRRTTAIVIAGLVVVGGGAVAADALGEQPTTEMETIGELPTEGLGTSGSVTLGELTVTNDHFFSRTTQLQRHTACIYDGERMYEEDIDFRQDNRFFWTDRVRLGPGDSQQYTMTIDGWTFYRGDDTAEAFQGVDSLPVSVADTCPSSSDEPQLIIRPGSSNHWWG